MSADAGTRVLRACFLAVAAAAAAGPATAGTLRFAGLDWEVKSGEKAGPGPNAWSESNAWVDGGGRLHLKVAQRDGRWTCAEIATRKSFRFGIYRFFVDAPLDRLDRNVVLGLFTYPQAGSGPDGTNEIDVEFAQWGTPFAPRGHYSAWPSAAGLKRFHDRFYFRLKGTYTAHRWYWGDGFVRWESFHGHREDDGNMLARRLFRPKDRARVARDPARVHVNLWLAGGRPPSDGREAEVVIADFRWSPFEDPAALLRRIAATRAPAEAKGLLRAYARQSGMDPDAGWVDRLAAALAEAGPEARQALLSSLARGAPAP